MSRISDKRKKIEKGEYADGRMVERANYKGRISDRTGRTADVRTDRDRKGTRLAG